MANILSTDKQIAVIGALAEGSSIRSIERMTGIHRDTVMRLGVRVGQGCAGLLDAKMRDLPCRYLQFDEVWGFIGKKERHLRIDDNPQYGDVWTFCAIDADTKIVPSSGNRARFLERAATHRSNLKPQMLRGRISIEMSFGTMGNGGYMFDPDKWAEEADKKLAQKLDVDARKDAAFLAKRELLNAQAPQFWDNLRKVLQTMCEAYNKRKKEPVLAFDPVPNDTVKIRCTDGHDELLGKYDSGSASVRLETVRGGFVESYSAKVIPNHEGHVVLIKQGHGVISVEDIATRALNYLLGL